MTTARLILDERFTAFDLEPLDPKGALRTWLSSRYTPAAIRQGLAIFAAEKAKGRLKSPTAHHYQVKVIQNCQEEIDLREQEEQLRKWAEVERRGLLRKLEKEHDLLVSECRQGEGSAHDLAFRLSEKAVFGSMVLQRSFWEGKLKTLLTREKTRIESVIRHVRRLFEAEWNDRFQLIHRMISWDLKITT